MIEWPPAQQHLRALFDAYVESSGVPLTPSPLRKQVLREMDRRALTPEDVRAVIGRIQHHLRSGTKGYTDASLDWRNAMANVDIFEERALKLRLQKKARKSPAAPTRPIESHEIAPDRSPEISRGLATLKRRLRGGGQP
jgi:hypothetical protein